jgi:hypothetical protein
VLDGIGFRLFPLLCVPESDWEIRVVGVEESGSFRDVAMEVVVLIAAGDAGIFSASFQMNT